MAHDGDDGRPRLELAQVLFLDGGPGHSGLRMFRRPRLEAKSPGHRGGRLIADGLVDGGHNAALHELLDDLHRGNAQLIGQFPHREGGRDGEGSRGLGSLSVAAGSSLHLRLAPPGYGRGPGKLLQRLAVLLADLGAEGHRQPISLESSLPAGRVRAQVGAPAGLLPCKVNLYPALRKANHAHEIPLGRGAAAANAGTPRDVLWSRAHGYVSTSSSSRSNCSSSRGRRTFLTFLTLSPVSGVARSTFLAFFLPSALTEPRTSSAK